MNRNTWIGIIIWGIFITILGLGGAGEVQAHDVTLLVAAGLVSCLIGVIGLIGLMGWVPGLDFHAEQNS